MNRLKLAAIVVILGGLLTPRSAPAATITETQNCIANLYAATCTYDEQMAGLFDDECVTQCGYGTYGGACTYEGSHAVVCFLIE